MNMEAFSLETVPKKASDTVISISVFGRFSMQDRRNRVKKYTYCNENELEWTGENKTKTLVWSKIFCFFLIETETDTFKNTLLWSGTLTS